MAAKPFPTFHPGASTPPILSRLVLASGVLAVTACGPWQRVSTPRPAPPPTPQIAALADPLGAFRQMGLVTGAGQIPFVGTVRLFAGRSADTAVVVVALSLEARQLTFQRVAGAFAAGYRVEIEFRRGATVVQQVGRDERVVVNTLREAQRPDESAIFQEFIPVAAGDYRLSIAVRDQNGPKAGSYESALTVPALVVPAISTPLAVYQATRRTDLAAPPDLLVNPRSTVDYGADTARFYVETYGLPPASTLVVSALDASNLLTWADTARLDSAGTVRAIIVALPPSRFPMGRYDLKVALEGGGVVSQAPFLVGVSGLWGVTNFDEMISLLRYFTSADTLHALASVPADQRAAAWRKFWHDTDPNRATPENEALDAYFARLQEANQLFQDEGVPGWLTDRGEVLITLGEPDEVLDRRSEMSARGRYIIWTYTSQRLTLYFVDDSGFGRFRLDPASRAEFLNTVNRLRRSS